ncbi:retinol-binding protein [Anopheles darlingi]|uniref:Retinol-binding protein n=1 Tax=Anopheles darlingi TaxID=43151 RepID=W5JSK3_ANODA|nr:retinol-binding protein [Anopheles darlingi]
MPWERPASVPYPNVWWTFEAPDPDREDGGLATYRVEDLTEDRFDDVMKLYTEHFLDDEPLFSTCGIRQDAESYEESRKFWKHAFSRRLTVVCYKEGSKELVGANLLGMSLANDKVDSSNLVYKNREIEEIVGIHNYMSEVVNLYERYGVDMYLTAYGLSVNTRFRGLGIATEILKARIPICRAFGVKLTSTNFTAVGSQKAAAKAGFKTDFEMP